MKQERVPEKKSLVLAAVFLLAILAYFKYFNFFADNLNTLLGALHLDPVKHKDITLPIGISFYIFHAISSIVDVHRQEEKSSKSLIDYTLYITFFPQLVAGPIIRFADVAKQLKARTIAKDDTFLGISRFIFGLAKKVIIANNAGLIVDNIYRSYPTSEWGFSTALIFTVLYTIQIYFDFSGYSDMALGLARIFGFKFKENFNYPYMSSSITDFWRRWHISLSSWFRDYVYVPLGGNRVSKGRNLFNLYLVFFLTGLWHGPSYNFIFWGLWHGTFLVLEKKWRKNANEFSVLSWLYTLVIVMLGWVLFRVETLIDAGNIYQSLLGLNGFSDHVIIRSSYWIFIALGVICAGPYLNIQVRKSKALTESVTIGLLLVCVVLLMNSTYNPFIYFRF